MSSNLNTDPLFADILNKWVGCSPELYDKLTDDMEEEKRSIRSGYDPEEECYSDDEENE